MAGEGVLEALARRVAGLLVLGEGVERAALEGDLPLPAVGPLDGAEVAAARQSRGGRGAGQDRVPEEQAPGGAADLPARFLVGGVGGVPAVASVAVHLGSCGKLGDLTVAQERERRLPLQRLDLRDLDGLLLRHHHEQAAEKVRGGLLPVVEGGLPVPADKYTVPKSAFAALLARALRPPQDLQMLPFTADQFLLTFSQPNYMFHAATVYDILRMRGVPLGKRDFMGQLRLATA